MSTSSSFSYDFLCAPFCGQTTATPNPARRRLVASCQTRRSKGTARFWTMIRILRRLLNTGSDPHFLLAGDKTNLAGQIEQMVLMTRVADQLDAVKVVANDDKFRRTGKLFERSDHLTGEMRDRAVDELLVGSDKA